MYVFLSNLRPRSVNAKYSEKYKRGIRDAFKIYCANLGLLNRNLYGIIYYFHNVPTQLDADNISKPVWDALETAAYPDDKMIKLRSAGVFDLRSEPIEVLELSQVPDSVFVDFLQTIDSEEHILYVEVGKLNYSLFKFSCAETSEV